MIPQRNISLLSNRLAKDGGRRIPEAVLERDYCLAWFLATLSGSPLKAILAFKGGTALKRCYFDDYRFSEDLDFTLLRPTSLEDICNISKLCTRRFTKLQEFDSALIGWTVTGT